MRPYPPSNKPGSAEQSLLRLLGGVLAFLSLLLTLLGIILHQRAADLILASIVGIFALRVLVLWLGDTPQHHRPIPGWSSMERVRDALPPAAVAPPPPTLPRSIRPQRPPIAPAFPVQPPQGVRPMPPAPPPSRWLPPPYASVPMPSPAPVPSPSRQGTWQYDDGENCAQQQGENDHETA